MLKSPTIVLEVGVHPVRQDGVGDRLERTGHAFDLCLKFFNGKGNCWLIDSRFDVDFLKESSGRLGKRFFGDGGIIDALQQLHFGLWKTLTLGLFDFFPKLIARFVFVHRMPICKRNDEA